MNKYLFIFLIILATIRCSFAADPINIYANTQAGMLSPTVKDALNRAYVPIGKKDIVTVIDLNTYQVINSFKTGREPQHVVPSYDLKTLWVLNNRSNSVTAIDPNTGTIGATFPVTDPYNLYFTPDGKYAIVVCEGHKVLQFRDAQTMNLVKALPVHCAGANHMDFTADNNYALVTCEFSGEIMKVDLAKFTVDSYLSFTKKDISQKSSGALIIDKNGKFSIETATQINKNSSMPQDIRSSANGSLFYVADMMVDGLRVINPTTMQQVGFIHTSIGAHGIYPSRDGKLFYVSNRGCHRMSCGPHGQGSVSVVDPAKQQTIATWTIPGGGSPDMGNVTADGKELWLSGRYDSEVYVFDTATGNLTHRIPVGPGPHGLAVWPQPGRYSLGHTGNMR